MAGVASVEADVVAHDGLVAPCVVGGMELLAATLVHDGDDAAQMVGEEVEDAIGLTGLLLVEHIATEVVEPAGGAALDYFLIVAHVVGGALQGAGVPVEPCAPPLVVGAVVQQNPVVVSAVVTNAAHLPEGVVLSVELRCGESFGGCCPPPSRHVAWCFHSSSGYFIHTFSF